MKIQPSLDLSKSQASSTPSSTRRADAPAGGNAGAAAAPSGAAAGTSVDLGAFDATKVAAIKEAISEGKMSVDSSVIADRLIADALALAGKSA